MSDPIRFRPHHFLCALGYEGKGYSGAFTANMTRIVTDRLHAPGGDDMPITVTMNADSICAPCPERRGMGCVKQTQISALDKRHAQALNLKDGQNLSWGEGKARIRAAVPPGSLATLCANCQWLSLGACERALAALHDADTQSTLDVASAKPQTPAHD